MKAWTLSLLALKLGVPRSLLLRIVSRLQAEGRLPPFGNRVLLGPGAVALIDAELGGGAPW